MLFRDERKKEHDDFTRENALGDGNCAFNAFILAITNKAVLEGIEEFLNRDSEALTPDFALAPFIRPVAEKLGIDLLKIEENKEENAQWNAIKDALLKLRTSDKIKLQKDLAPIMRQLAMDRITHDETSHAIHLEGSRNALQSEFKQFLGECRRVASEAKTTLADALTDENVLGSLESAREKVRTRSVGEIFYPHEFIQEQFYGSLLASLVNISNLGIGFDPQEEDNIILQTALANLEDWWKSEGHENFIDAMGASAQSALDTKLYASDLELAPLARFFNINLTIRHPEFGFNLMVNNHGAVPMDSPEVKAIGEAYFNQKLRNAGIVERIDVGKYQFEPLSRDEVIQRLTKLGSSESVKANFLKLWDENYQICEGVVLAHGGTCMHWDNMQKVPAHLVKERKGKGGEESDEEIALRLALEELGLGRGHGKKS